MTKIASILWQSSQLVVLNKESRVHTLRGKDSENPNLQDWIEKEFPSTCSLKDSGFLQRLDFETSGCIAAALDEATYKEWTEKSKNFQKVYLCASSQKIEECEVEFYFHSRYRSSKKVKVEKSGKPGEFGRARFRPLRFEDGVFYTEAELLSHGKRHQIRASASALGAPLLGDVLYGGPESSFFGLHAWKLKCDLFSATCPLPTPWPKPPL